MPTIVRLQEFFTTSTFAPMIDVRTPAEYAKGHIPGAVNIPLFSDAERAEVGTVYKQRGKKAAILVGLDLVGTRLRHILETLECIAQNKREICVYCWRGGMRSSSVAWLFELYGYSVQTLHGGYKSYRRFVREFFQQPRVIRILGGKTGSGKTRILQHLSALGEQIVDLEALAHHKGSAFGALGEQEQPTQEQFDNNLVQIWLELDHTRPVWLEDESQKIGRSILPDELWSMMRIAPTYFLELPVPLRIQRIIGDYGAFQPEELCAAVQKISKRLGGLLTQQIEAAIHSGDLTLAVEYILQYYDKTYVYGLSQRDPQMIISVPCWSLEPLENAQLLLQSVKKC